MISVILITKNEASKIEKCLRSVSWADEIIIFDSGSSDATLEIAKKYTDKIYKTDWPGFGPQKQRALEKAKYEWVFSIDADEVVSEELKKEMMMAIEKNECDGYFMPRLTYFCGKPIYQMGWYPDYLIRLFKKSKSRFSEDLVHEKVLVEGALKKLKEPLIHESYENLNQFMHKINVYSELGAQKLFQKNESSGLLKALIRGFLAFFKLYFFKRGFLEGREGFIISVSSAESAYYKYLKLWQLQKNKKLK